MQEALENALTVAIRAPAAVIGAGRTDRGVHARGQVAHFHTELTLDTRRTLRSLNGLTPAAIAVHALEKAPDGFHARFDASSRRYHYYVSTRPAALARHYRYVLPSPIDFCIMNKAAAHLLGEHHFGAFCLQRSATRNRVCTVSHAQWIQEGRAHEWHFVIEANRFLHGMVRAFVGTLFEIGRGKRSVADIKRVLATRDRSAAGPAAPPHGLVLESIRYAR